MCRLKCLVLLVEPGEKKAVAVATTSSAAVMPSIPHVEASSPPVARKSLPPMVLAPSTPIEVTYLDGRKEIWSKMLTRRSEGKTAGKIEIVICS